MALRSCQERIDNPFAHLDIMSEISAMDLHTEKVGRCFLLLFIMEGVMAF